MNNIWVQKIFIALSRKQPLFRKVMVALVQTLIAALSYFLAYLLRFDFDIPARYITVFLWTLPLLLAARMGTFLYKSYFSSLWRYTSLTDILSVIRINIFGSLIFVGLLFVSQGHGLAGVPRSVFIIDFVLCTAGIILAKIQVRGVHAKMAATLGGPAGEPVRTVIIDAGPEAVRIATEIQENPLFNYKLVGFLDDDPVRKRSTVLGLPVMGSVDELEPVLRRGGVDEVLVVVSDLPGESAARLRQVCQAQNVRIKVLPTTRGIIANLPLTSDMDICELEGNMGRELIHLSKERMADIDYTGQRVLVTGGAGSIGSELCRQIAALCPAKLIVLDQNESGVFNIGESLKRYHGAVQVELVVGDITNPAKLDFVLAAHRPDYIYHAAAYKHVPLMEADPIEAVTANIIGTYNLAGAAARHGCRRLVFISTDKAVNPESIMGMTKFVAEQIVVGSELPGGKSLCVRFGNVLDSAGSVLPLFRRQVRTGGPLTVTHPEVTRYFMSIAEAVYLIMEAAEIGGGGEVFLLKMGQAVKILDLAKKVITASGQKPFEDVEIVFTGLRPGERMHEPLYWEGEDIDETAHPDIKVMTRVNQPLADLDRLIAEIAAACQAMDTATVTAQLKDLVGRLSVR